MAQLNLPLSQDEPETGESTRHHRTETRSALPRVNLNEIVKDSIAFTEDYASATRDERGARVRFRTELGQDLPPVLASPSELREVFVNLNEIVKDSIAFTEDYASATRDERGARVRFRTEPGKDLPPVLASPSELREVFVHLLRNAVDAVEGEGEVVVRTRADSAHGVVEVSDTGTGMSPGVQEKLFSSRFTTKGDRGTGLGLATCYAIVRRHGGDIQVKSAPGEGTTFTVKLPFAE